MTGRVLVLSGNGLVRRLWNIGNEDGMGTSWVPMERLRRYSSWRVKSLFMGYRLKTVAAIVSLSSWISMG